MVKARAAYDGVSVEVAERGAGRVWMLRWRQPETTDGRVLTRRRCLTVYSQDEADRLCLEIRRALRERGWWEEPAATARPEAVFVSAEEAFAAWLEEEVVGRKGRGTGTVRKYAQSLDRWFVLLRAELGLPEGRAVAAGQLHRDHFARACLRMRTSGLSESSIYSTAQHVLMAWRWAADRPDRWPGLPPAPEPSGVLPDPPMYSAPEAPTMAEIDAVLRHLSAGAYVARYAAIIMRFTGLRISQTLALTREDLDVQRRTLTIRLGKGRRETQEARTIPVSVHLLTELAPVLAEPGTSLVPRRRDLRAEVNQSHIPTATLNAAWAAAVEEGSVRRLVWRPPNRRLGRPDHGFRAALQAFLEEHGVREKIIDRLVGHAPQGVRARHYVPPKEADLRAAVELIPPIRWEGSG